MSRICKKLIDILKLDANGNVLSFTNGSNCNVTDIYYKNGKISFDELFSHYKKINGVEGITDDIKNESPSSLLIKTEV